MIKKFWKKIFSVTAESAAKKYLKKDRYYTYKGLKIKVLKDVFHPGLFRSTKIFAEWLQTQILTNKKVLELGCGTGLLSLIAAKNNASVTAIDINPKAVYNATLNATLNNIEIEARQSDLFSAISKNEVFDIVLINPPYFPKSPENDYQHAWYCGENFEYFQNFFKQISKRAPRENYYLILSDNCDLNAINNVAANHFYSFKEIYCKKKSGEVFFIYQIQPIS